MAALPYMQLYIADYLADTQHLTCEEHGAYLLLLFNYWQTGKPLNNKNNRLASVVKLTDERWTDVQQVLSEFFEIDPETDLWMHGRIESDLESVNGLLDKKRKAGRQSARARAAKSKKKKVNRRSTSEEQVPIYTDTNTDTDTDKSSPEFIKDSFSRFWSEWPVGFKAKRRESFDVWKKKKLYLLVDQIINDVKERKVKHKRWVDGFVPNPTTYLRGLGWEDDINEKNPGRVRQVDDQERKDAIRDFAED